MPGYGDNGLETLRRVDLDMALVETTEAAQSEGLIGMQLAPRVKVRGRRGDFPVVRESQINQPLVSNQRGEYGRFNEINIYFSTGQYKTETFGLGSRIDRDQASSYESDWDQDLHIAEAIRVNCMKNYEKRVIDKALAVAGTQPAAPGNQNGDNPAVPWTDPASTPLTDFVDYKLLFRNRRRVFSNKQLLLALDYEVAEQLRFNIQLLEKIRSTVDKFSGDVDNALLAHAFGVGQVVIANSWENQSASGTAENDVEYALQWPKTKAFLCVASAERKKAHRWCNTISSGTAISGWEQSYDWDTSSDKMRYREEYALHEVDAGSALLINGVAG